MKNKPEKKIYPIYEDYWEYLLEKSEERLMKLLSDNGLTLGAIFGDEGKKIIESPKEAEYVLDFILNHASSSGENALAIIATTSWVNSYCHMASSGFSK